MHIQTVPTLEQLRQSTKSIILPIVDDQTLLAHYQNLLAPNLLQQLTQKPLKLLQNCYELLLPDGTTLYFIGCGEDQSFAAYQKIARRLAHQKSEHWPQVIGFFTPPTFPAAYLEACLNGIILGTYQIGRFKTAEQTNLFGGVDTEIQVLGDAKLQPYLNSARAIGLTQRRVFDLVNAPANKKRPRDLADWAQQSGEENGFEVAVWDLTRCTEEGFGGLMAVNAGSPDPACFIQMRYRGKETEHPIVLVGKGVTFDTGGVSIKPSNNLHLMKSDMGGAAAVFGAVEAAARKKLPIDLVGLVPVTDNSVDAKAFKPSDVITSYNGKTIEIIDTDAEGRLILADGIGYALKNYEPSVLIDLATLTGSSVRALGYAAGALFSKDEQLISALTQAGASCGEKLWRLPLWKEYGEDLKSDVADIRNLGSKPVAGAITAAKFLEFFTDEFPHWAHLDIAGVALAASEFSTDRSATGFGIRLLVTYLEHLGE